MRLEVTSPGLARFASSAPVSHRLGNVPADVRYLDMLDAELLAGGMVYAVAILENHSRAVLASSLTRRQDLNAFLSVLYRAVQE